MKVGGASEERLTFATGVVLWSSPLFSAPSTYTSRCVIRPQAWRRNHVTADGRAHQRLPDAQPHGAGWYRLEQVDRLRQGELLHLDLVDGHQLVSRE